MRSVIIDLEKFPLANNLTNKQTDINHKDMYMQKVNIQKGKEIKIQIK